MFRTIEEFPLYEINNKLVIRNKTTKRIKKPHRNGDTVRLYIANSQKECSRKIEKLFNAAFPELVCGSTLPEYPTYRIRENGDVYSLHQCSVLKPAVGKDGYMQVSLKDTTGKYKSELVHRLVAKAFLKEPIVIGTRITVNHKDGVKTNNSKNNLEWVTHSENIYHAVSTGLYKSKMRECLISLDNTEWKEFKSFEDARKYISTQVGKNVVYSQIRDTALKNSKYSTKNGAPVEYNPFRCHGYAVKYKCDNDRVTYSKNMV